MKTERRIPLSTLFLLFFYSIVIISSAWGGDRLVVTFLDVGEGEAIYFDAPTGEKILIDAGNLITGRRLVNFLKKQNVNALDALFITHPHPDHMGGVFHLLQDEDIRIKAVYDNGQSIPALPEHDVYRWYAYLARNDDYGVAGKGDIFSYGKLKLKVLWPEAPVSRNWNENSLVLMAVYGDVSILLMGDANKNVEDKLLKGGGLKAEILKVGHHGADDASGEDFISAVSPDYAVISTNDGNLRGYPDPSVLGMLRKKGIKVLTTYSEGDIIMEVNGQEAVLHYSQ